VSQRVNASTCKFHVDTSDTFLQTCKVFFQQSEEVSEDRLGADQLGEDQVGKG